MACLRNVTRQFVCKKAALKISVRNGISAQPLSRFGIFPVFSRAAAKVNGHSSFMVIANGSFGLAVLRHS
jgi:hypothetical protein